MIAFISAHQGTAGTESGGRVTEVRDEQLDSTDEAGIASDAAARRQRSTAVKF